MKVAALFTLAIVLCFGFATVQAQSCIFPPQCLPRFLFDLISSPED
jgi:hypothetical protein